MTFSVWLLMRLVIEEPNSIEAVYRGLKEPCRLAEQEVRTRQESTYKGCQNVVVACRWERVRRGLLVMHGITDWDYSGRHHQTDYVYYAVLHCPVDKRKTVYLAEIGQAIGKAKKGR